MGFFFGIAAGIATYQWLFKMMHIEEETAQALGWVVGIGIIILIEGFQYAFNKLSEQRSLALKIRMKELEQKGKQEAVDAKKQKENNLNFFKQKEM